MKPSQATTATLVIVLIGALVLLGMNLLNQDTDQQDTTGGLISLPSNGTPEPTAIPPMLPDAQLEFVTHFKLTNNTTGDVLSGSTNDDGTWRVTRAPKGVDTHQIVDSGRISSAMSGLPSIVPTRVLNGMEDLTGFGLSEAKRSYTLDVTIGNAQYTLWIGDKNPGETGYYVQVKGHSDIYLLSTFALSPILGLLDAPPLVTATPELAITPTP